MSNAIESLTDDEDFVTISDTRLSNVSSLHEETTVKMDVPYNCYLFIVVMYIINEGKKIIIKL